MEKLVFPLLEGPTKIIEVMSLVSDSGDLKEDLNLGLLKWLLGLDDGESVSGR